jgi:hypothetical protein
LCAPTFLETARPRAVRRRARPWAPRGSTHPPMSVRRNSSIFRNESIGIPRPRGALAEPGRLSPTATTSLMYHHLAPGITMHHTVLVPVLRPIAAPRPRCPLGPSLRPQQLLSTWRSAGSGRDPQGSGSWLHEPNKRGGGRSRGRSSVGGCGQSFLRGCCKRLGLD